MWANWDQCLLGVSLALSFSGAAPSVPTTQEVHERQVSMVVLAEKLRIHEQEGLKMQRDQERHRLKGERLRRDYQRLGVEIEQAFLAQELTYEQDENNRLFRQIEVIFEKFNELMVKIW